MSQSHEPSYYEIALTNRQVLIVFVVLLICVVVAFFSGVWVGRRDAPASPSEVAQLENLEASSGQDEASAVGELHFFTETESPDTEGPSLAELAEEPKADSTLLEDLAGAEPEATREEAPVEAASGSTATRVGPASPATGYVIQVFSSPDEKQARRLLDELNDGGYPAFLSPVEVGSQTMMRVRIGPYPELAAAESVAEKIRRDFKLDTWVTH